MGRLEEWRLRHRVKLRIEDKSLPQGNLAARAKEVHEKICPYSHATRGQVDAQLRGGRRVESQVQNSLVTAGLVPAIYEFACKR